MLGLFSLQRLPPFHAPQQRTLFPTLRLPSFTSSLSQPPTARGMAMKARIQKDRLKRKVSAEMEAQRNELRATARDFRLSPQERLQARLKLHTLRSESRPISIRDRCVVTGRARGVVRDFKISRIIMREWAHRGMLPGVTKASW